MRGGLRWGCALTLLSFGLFYCVVLGVSFRRVGVESVPHRCFTIERPLKGQEAIDPHRSLTRSASTRLELWTWDVTLALGSLEREARLFTQLTSILGRRPHRENEVTENREDWASTSPPFILLQGASPHLIETLHHWLNGGAPPEGYTAAPSVIPPRFGCSAFTYTHRTPSSAWGRDLARWLSGDLPQEERGLWSWSPLAVVKAERWALPPRPGRFPQRAFHLQPAVLSLTTSDHPPSSTPQKTLQIINLQLPDGVYRQRSAALGLSLLDRSPLKEAFRAPWVLGGAFYITPPQRPAHPQMNYRFQRATITPLLEDFPHAPSSNKNFANLDMIGRWRLRPSARRPAVDQPQEQTSVEVIDYFFADRTGGLKSEPLPSPLGQWWISKATKLNTETSIQWIEERAPTRIRWIPVAPMIGEPLKQSPK